MLIAVVKAIVGIVLLGGVWLATAALGRRGGVEAGCLDEAGTLGCSGCGRGLCQPAAAEESPPAAAQSASDGAASPVRVPVQ